MKKKVYGKMELEKLCVIGGLGEKEVIIFSPRSISKTSMAKMYGSKRNIVASFSVRNIGYEVTKIYRRMKSILNLSPTRRTDDRK